MEFQIQDLATQNLPALDGKFLVVETRSDGYTGTVAGNYNYEVEMSANEYYIYPTFWDDYEEKFERQDALVVYTSGNTVYTAGNIREDPFSPTEIRKLIVYNYMQKDKRVVQAFKIFANEAFTIGKYNIFIKDIIAKDNPNIIHVTGVSISNKNLSLNVGDKKKISYNIEPSNATRKDVEFKSSNTDVVAVSDSGEVTAKKVGEATITVTTEDGNKSSTCTVAVEEPVVKVESIDFDKDAIELEIGNKKKVTATVNPSNATSKAFEYMSSNNSIASVDQEGTVTANRAGSVNIVAKTEDGGYEDTCRVTVTDPEPEDNGSEEEENTEE